MKSVARFTAKYNKRQAEKLPPYSDFYDSDKLFFDQYAQTVKLKTLCDWYSVSLLSICERGGRSVISRYRNSVLMALETNYPEYEWDWQRFGRLPRGFWDDKESHVDEVDGIGELLGVKVLDDWYDINTRAILTSRPAAHNLLQLYNKSIPSLLEAIYPHHSWDLVRFRATPRDIWRSKASRRRKLDSAAEKLDIKTACDWYNVKYVQLQKLGVGGVLSNYAGVMYALEDLFPEYKWERRRYLPPVASADQSVYVDKFNDLGLKLCIKNLDQWYDLLPHQLKIVTADDLITSANSVSKGLLYAFPDHKWTVSKFTSGPYDYWIENQRYRLESMAPLLDIKIIDDWQYVSVTRLRQVGLNDILARYGTPKKMLKSIYYEFEWRFTYTPFGHWSKPKNQVSFLTKLANRFNIQSPEHWYRLSDDDIISTAGGPGFLQYYPKSLKIFNPSVKWDWNLFFGYRKKSKQRLLFTSLQKLFPSSQIVEEHLISTSGVRLSLDVYIAEYNLALEYQGEQHYHDAIFPHSPPTIKNEALDNLKLQQCENAGISLVRIPYWWPGDLDSLMATILYIKPDIKFDRPCTSLPLGNIPITDTRSNTVALMMPNPTMA